MTRTPMLAGNWKMNRVNADLEAYFSAFSGAIGPVDSVTEHVDVLFAVPYTLLDRAVRLAEPLGFRIAAQNLHQEASGAFTGEVSISMLKELGVTSSLIGHSERRQYYAETDESVARKTLAALKAGFMPVVCIGETLEEREKGRTEAVITRQVKAVLDPMTEAGDLVLAYEPVWAIGTGKSATAGQAQEVHHLIRRLISTRFGESVATRTRILYGGSASPTNIDELLAQPDIDGGLVGGASLKPNDFGLMVKAAMARSR